MTGTRLASVPAEGDSRASEPLLGLASDTPRGLTVDGEAGVTTGEGYRILSDLRTVQRVYLSLCYRQQKESPYAHAGMPSRMCGTLRWMAICKRQGHARLKPPPCIFVPKENWITIAGGILIKLGERGYVPILGVQPEKKTIEIEGVKT